LKTVVIFVQTLVMKKLLFVFALAILAASCGGNGDCKDCNKKKDEPVKDTVVDTYDDAVARDTSTTRTREQQINHEKIVKKYGEQWDFCKCVVALDSIDDAVQNSTLTDAQVEKLMNRWDHVDNKCKEITTFDNQTPDERAKHEKRVSRCLKEAGIKR
jgi:hypothetical protein